MTGGAAGVQVPVEVYLEAARLDGFTIDLSTDLHTVARLERTHPTPVVQMPGLPPLPEFVLYPLPDQVADKVCAMYELHGDRELPSTRFRDLVDLVLITMSFPLDAALTTAALASETARRRLTLPDTLTSPGPDWDRGYRAIARESRLRAARDPGAQVALQDNNSTGRCARPADRLPGGRRAFGEVVRDFDPGQATLMRSFSRGELELPSGCAAPHSGLVIGRCWTVCPSPLPSARSRTWPVII
jgi:Nucleotidyl transferase AbiEii toxin, Type IV TA system